MTGQFRGCPAYQVFKQIVSMVLKGSCGVTVKMETMTPGIDA